MNLIKKNYIIICNITTYRFNTKIEKFTFDKLQVFNQFKHLITVVIHSNILNDIRISNVAIGSNIEYFHIYDNIISKIDCNIPLILK